MVFQLNTPLLDGCVLAILEQGDAYGYNLTQRRYYAITQSGRALLAECRRDWTDYTCRVAKILSGGDEG